MSTELFKPTASPPEDALVLIFDLEGFSHFFSQPEVHRYVPKYLNTIFEAVDIAIYDRPDYWLEDSPSEQQTAAIPAPLAAPIHFKFMGDGGLYIWKMSDPQNSKNLLNFVNRLWNLKINFDKVVLRALEEIPVADVPKKIRIGLAAGSVYKPQKTKHQA